MTARQAMLIGLYAAGATAVIPVLLGLDAPVFAFVVFWGGHLLWEWRRGAVLRGRGGTLLAYALSLLIFWLGPGTLFDRIYLFLLWLLTVRYLAPKGVRDAFQILILAVAVLAAGGVLYPDPVFGLVFVVFLGISILTASLTYVYAELGDLPLRGRDIRTLLIHLLPFEGATLGLSVLFFVFLPRSSLPLFAPVLRTSGTAVGVSDTLRLGHFRELLEDGTPVARVVPLDGVRRVPRVYLRMRVYGVTRDGRVWEPWDGLPAPPAVASRGEVEGYELVVEPLQVPVLPVVQGTFRLEGGPPEAHWYFRRDGTVWADPPIRGLRHRYGVWRRRGAVYRDPPGRVFRELPEEIPPALAETLRVWGGGVTDPRELAHRLQRRFWQFAYALEDPPGRGHPIANFLRARRGYCEYFATAMVLMLRLAGVPARVVGGLAGGRWNPQGNYWVLEQRDAHTWVEAWIPGEGWVLLDPTPPVRFASSIREEMVGVSAIWDYVRLLWARRVVQYSREDQVRMALSGVEGVKRALRWIPGVLGVVLIGVWGWGVWLRRSQGEDPVRRDMLQLLAWMESRWPRHGGEGLRTYARRLGIPEFEDLVERYYAHRFGNRRVIPSRFRAQVARVRQRLKGKKSSG